jgi:hypothetical protein
MVFHPLVERSTTVSKAIYRYDGIVTSEVALRQAANMMTRLKKQNIDHVVYHSSETSAPRATHYSRDGHQSISFDRLPDHKFKLLMESLFLGGANTYENVMIIALPQKKSSMFFAGWSKGAHGVLKLRTRRHRIYTGGPVNLGIHSKDDGKLISDKSYSSIDDIKSDKSISNTLRI